jgi:Tol biopolymer transport system component/predicted Ser/Thr protein kinase
MVGRTLGHYRIDSKLGEGGMGVVYRATDTRLDRRVAVKVLRPDAMADPVRKRRFIQEAKTASALNHPNIITVYDVHSDDGTDYIAMEYVEGRTLDQATGRRGLGLTETLKYGIQIADALARAHAAGIIHRDLKPANVMITNEGLVKVLDFGLAKLAEPADSDPSAETVTVPASGPPPTQEGVIVGTVAYMSPEQAESRKIDARSDIFAFGSVLYEMVTGRPAFHGASTMSTLSAILHQEPKPLREAVEGAPRDLEKVVARCLRKEPDRRFQHMADVKVALQEILQDAESGQLAAESQAGVRPKRRGILVAAGLAALTGFLAGWWIRRTPAESPLSLTQVTFDTGLTTDPALSPDGKLIAYASDRAGEGDLDIWVQQLSGGQAIRLTRHAADDREPAFSPDGSRIAFRSEREGGGVYAVPALGGDERLIAPQGRRPRFSPDGSQIAYWVGNLGGSPAVPGTSKIYVVAAGGGNPRQLQPDFPAARYPVWSPDGKSLVFWAIGDLARRNETSDWWVSPADGGAAIQTGAYARFRSQGLGLPPGSYVFAPAGWAAAGVVFSARLGDSTNLWRLPLDPANRKAGAPRRLTGGSGVELQPSEAGAAVAFASIEENIDIWKLPVDTARARVTGPLERLTTSAAPDVYPTASASGRNIAFLSRRSGVPEVWVKDLATGKETSVATPEGGAVWIALSADGSRLAYGAFEKPWVHLVPAAGGPVQRVAEGRGVWSFSPDGRKLLIFSAKTEGAVSLLDLGTREQVEILNAPGYGIFRARFSPDGRWIAFHARNRPGRSAIFVAPFRGALVPREQWIPVTDGESYDFSVTWSADGNVLYFLSERDAGLRCIWATRLNPATKRPAGAPFPVQHFHSATRPMVHPQTNILGLAAARDMLVFNLSDISGNIWTTARRPGDEWFVF